MSRTQRALGVRLVVVISLLAAQLPVTVLAQGPPPPQLSPKKREAATKLQKQLAEVARKLGAIQESAIKKAPKLREAGMKLQSLIEATMKRQGIDPRKLVARLQELQTKGQKATKDDVRKKLMMEFTQIRQALEMAEQRAMADKKVASARDAFRKKLEAAMIKTDPAARKLLREFKKLTGQLKKLIAA